MQICKYCKSPGKVKKIEGLYYAQCSSCTKRDPYECLGLTEQDAIQLWDVLNSKYVYNNESNDL